MLVVFDFYAARPVTSLEGQPRCSSQNSLRSQLLLISPCSAQVRRGMKSTEKQRLCRAGKAAVTLLSVAQLEVSIDLEMIR